MKNIGKTIAIRFHEVGQPEVMKYEEVDMPQPGRGEIRMEVEAIGVGYGEALYRMGFYVQETILPSSLGNNAVGRVDAVGEGVEGIEIGQRIGLIPSFSMNQYGVYAKHAIVPATAIAPYFDSLSLEENASIWMQVVTAYVGIVHHGKIQSDDTLLVLPGSGGVGMAAIQTGKKAGATVITTTRRREKENAIRAIGADHVIVTDEEELESRVLEITDGVGVRLILNALTGDVLHSLANVAHAGGTILQFGGIGAQPTPLPYAQIITKGINIRGFTLYELTDDPSNLEKLRQYVADGIRDGFYTANVGKVFQFEEMVEVHRYLEAGSMTGSVVVRVQP